MSLTWLRQKIRPYRWLHWMLRHKHLSFEELQDSRLYFSQFGEDIFLTNSVFPTKCDGFYVDCGAYHPFRGSNTHLLWKRGWHGINIEPNPTQLEKFNQYRPNDINLGMAVSDVEQVERFVCDDVFSGIDSEARSVIAARHPDRCSSEVIEIKCLRLQTILATYAPSVEVDLLSVDCEGHDLQVLRSYDWSGPVPYCIIAETHGCQRESINQLLVGKGYSHLITLGLSGIYVRGA